MSKTRSFRLQEKYGKDSANHDRRIGIYYDDSYNLIFDKWFRKYVDDFAHEKPVEVSVPKIKRATFIANLQQHVLRDCAID